MNILQRTTENIYFKMKTGQTVLDWVTLLPILSPGLPSTKAGTAEEERGETCCQGHQQQSAGWGPRCPAPAHSQRGRTLGSTAECTQRSLYKSKGATPEAPINCYVSQVGKQLNDGGRRGGVGRGGGFQRESATKQQTWTCCNTESREYWTFNTSPFYLQMMVLIQTQCKGTWKKMYRKEVGTHFLLILQIITEMLVPGRF